MCVEEAQSGEAPERPSLQQIIRQMQENQRQLALVQPVVHELATKGFDAAAAMVGEAGVKKVSALLAQLFQMQCAHKHYRHLFPDEPVDGQEQPHG